MTQAAASYREDVEQLGRQFAESRSTHAVRSRLPEELEKLGLENPIP